MCLDRSETVRLGRSTPGSAPNTCCLSDSGNAKSRSKRLGLPTARYSNIPRPADQLTPSFALPKSSDWSDCAVTFLGLRTSGTTARPEPAIVANLTVAGQRRLTTTARTHIRKTTFHDTHAFFRQSVGPCRALWTAGHPMATLAIRSGRSSDFCFTRRSAFHRGARL
jgi:hypothetical protein